MQALPTIGVFSHGVTPVETMPPLRLRGMLGEAAIQGIELVFIGPEDCDLSGDRIEGRRWRDGAWQRRSTALPPLVVVTSFARSPKDEAFDAWLNAHTRVVGFRQRDKLGSAAILAASPLADHVIPAERIDPQRVEAQLSGWMQGGGIVVKATDGMRGIGVTFALPAGDGWELVRDRRRWPCTAAEAAAQIARTIGGRLAYRDYLVQRYIDSRDAHGQAVAVRIDLARVPGGGWDPFRLAGRIASGGALASTGVYADAIMTFDSFLDVRGVADVAAKKAELIDLSERIADTLAADDPPLSCYEIGLDFAIDPANRYWFIEANGRPQAVGVQHERAIRVMAYFKSLLALTV